MAQRLTPHQSQYTAWFLTRRAASDSVESLASTLASSQIDLNPHQVEAALFACRNPLSRGVILADEVGLGKTIEAGLVISQRWAERRRRVLVIVPANLRKQWHQELQDKFGLQGLILEAKSFSAMRKEGNPFEASGPVICSYQFAKTRANEIKSVNWDLVVFDEAHRLRNVYKAGNVIARTLKEALAHVSAKVLLTATPLQNSLLELYGLVSTIDEHVFGSLDSFRAQFSPGRSASFDNLRGRLAPICLRTLRKQVQPYVSYTKRIPIVQEFTPSSDEQLLSGLVREYLCRPNLKALPDGQRQLISLVLWKLLASSTHAIAGALDTMANRLQGVLDKSAVPDLAEKLDEDYEGLDEILDEWDEQALENSRSDSDEQRAIAQEIEELRRFYALAANIRNNAKGEALLGALERAFAELDRLGAAKKAIIFTESKYTQTYLLSLLQDTSYADDIVLFNGTNSDARAQAIYRDWLKRHEGSERVTGSKTADTRAALVEHFRERGTVMIATEAGAEGINLQFCSLVINYDLPWNPQRIEQRIGRCHRYGQKHDVVVVNFVDRSNEADCRVYELLEQKFQLFSGVFGASDEVLGAIGSGVDFERRIAEIYRNCRQSEEIKASFAQLQRDLSGEINEAMVKTRQLVLENFDEEVQEKLRVCEKNSRDALSRFEQMLMNLTQTELADHASFHSDGSFDLRQAPDFLPEEAEESRKILPGRYALRGAGEAQRYRVTHPLAARIIAGAKERRLAGACLVFDYNARGALVSTLKPHRGKSGWLTLKLLSVKALRQEEQHLIVAATTREGEVLEEGDPEKLLRLPATEKPPGLFSEANAALLDDIGMRKNALLRDVRQRNLSYFEQEVEKLDLWVDDLKLGLEQEITEIDSEIKNVRRSAAASELEEKLSWQKKQRELEGRRAQLRRRLFARQDEIEAQRDALIRDWEAQLEPQVEERELFTVEWELL